MAESGEEPKNAATGVVGAMRIYVLLEGVVDFAGERKRLEKEMKEAAKELDFERAAAIRDRIREIKKKMSEVGSKV